LSLGVKPGDNVALMMPNCVEFLYAWFGLNRIGAANVPINVSQRGHGLAYQIDQTDCVALVADEQYLEHLDLVADRVPKIRHVVMTRSGPGESRLPQWPGVESLRYGDLASRGEGTPDIPVPFNALSTILFTSGTTGPS